MSRIFKIVIVFGVLFCGAICSPTKAQEIPQETEVMQSDDGTDNATKKEKRKKDKDVIEIDEKFFLCLAINMAAVLIILGFIYYPNYRQFDYIFTFLVFNIVIFMLTFVLNKVKISMGAAFGLFAVFSMLRYRTEGISMKDMTYLFIFIALGLISAIQLEYLELIIINALIVVFTFLLDGNIVFRREYSEEIKYENIKLVNFNMRELLIEDLKVKTGLKIHRIHISKIDFVRDSALIKIYYYKK